MRPEPEPSDKIIIKMKANNSCLQPSAAANRKEAPDKHLYIEDKASTDEEPVPMAYLVDANDRKNEKHQNKGNDNHVKSSNTPETIEDIDHPTPFISDSKGEGRHYFMRPRDEEPPRTNPNELCETEAGLAVASPVEESEQNRPIYEAAEYKPSVRNQSLYASKKCRIFTALLLLVSLLVVVASVVYTSKKKNSIVAQPIESPKVGQATDNKLLGLKEIIESQVLQRDAKFDTMKDSDPRHLALNWILDGGLEDNTRLFQRYILALIAFSFDFLSWDCGVVFDLESCNDTDVDDDYSLWLTRTDECLWYGVSCADGAVQGLDLCEYLCYRFVLGCV